MKTADLWQSPKKAMHSKVLMAASVASMIDQFNMPNIRLMQQLGYEVHVACNFREGNTCDKKRVQKLQTTLKKMKVAMHQWDCPRSVTQIGQCRKAYRQMLCLVKNGKFCWIHCHSPIGGALVRLAARQKGVRVIYTAHGFHFYKGAPLQNWLLYYPVEKLLAHWTHVLVTVNREDFCFAKKHLKPQILRYIPGVGIDIEKFQGSRKELQDSQKEFQGSRKELQDSRKQQETSEAAGCSRKNDNGSYREFCRTYNIPPGAVVLLSVGELNAGKNHQMVIRALAQVIKTAGQMNETPDICYLICGQGEQKKDLQRLADRLGIGAAVRLPGYRENLQDVYRHADLFVFPSLREGMPAALMEAMAAGLPCIVSDIRGSRELIGPPCHGQPSRMQGGVRFSLGRGGQAQLTAALTGLLADEARRRAYGACNQKKMRMYAQERVQNRMYHIYSQMREESDA